MTAAAAGGVRGWRGGLSGLFLLLWACVGSPLQAQPSAAVSTQTAAPTISLLTFGPGAIYWQRFGHNALLVRDTAGRAIVYNYGIFDFAQDNFFANFTFGRMQYRLATDGLAHTLAQYAYEGRSVTEQVLALHPEQAHALAAYLAWNARPENAGYGYDYFRDNCSTRVRDALDQTLGGSIARRTQAQPGRLTLREQVLRLTAPDLPVMLGLDLILGMPADAAQSRWQESFVPMVLQQAVRELSLPATDRAPARALVAEEHRLLAENAARAAEAPAEQPPHLAGWFAAAGVLWAVLLLQLRSRTPRLWATAATLQLVLAGTAGMIMVFITAFTAHWAGWYNLSAAFYNPLAWLAIPALWRTVGGRVNGGMARALVWMLPVVAALGALGVFWQANLHHLLFWLPAHAALAVTCLYSGAATRYRVS